MDSTPPIILTGRPYFEHGFSKSLAEKSPYEGSISFWIRKSGAAPRCALRSKHPVSAIGTSHPPGQTMGAMRGRAASSGAPNQRRKSPVISRNFRVLIQKGIEMPWGSFRRLPPRKKSPPDLRVGGAGRRQAGRPGLGARAGGDASLGATEARAGMRTVEVRVEMALEGPKIKKHRRSARERSRDPRRRRRIVVDRRLLLLCTRRRGRPSRAPMPAPSPRAPHSRLWCAVRSRESRESDRSYRAAPHARHTAPPTCRGAPRAAHHPRHSMSARSSSRRRRRRAQSARRTRRSTRAAHRSSRAPRVRACTSTQARASERARPPCRPSPRVCKRARARSRRRTPRTARRGARVRAASARRRRPPRTARRGTRARAASARRSSADPSRAAAAAAPPCRRHRHRAARRDRRRRRCAGGSAARRARQNDKTTGARGERDL